MTTMNALPLSASRRQPGALRRIARQLGMVGLPILFLGFVASGACMQMDLEFCAVVFGVVAGATFLQWLNGWRAIRRTSASRRSFNLRLVMQTGLFVVLHIAAWLALTMLWPLRVTFAVSRPALERLSDRVERGDKTVRFPVRAGLLWVEGTRPMSWGGVALYMSRDGAGVVRSHKPDYSMCGGYQTRICSRWVIVQYD